MLNLNSTVVLNERTNAKNEKWQSGWCTIAELKSLIASAEQAGMDALNFTPGVTQKGKQKVTIKPWTMKNGVAQK